MDMSEREREDFEEEHLRHADVVLFVIHPTMTPDEITAALGLQPRTTHQVGHPRKTPKGTPLEGRYADTRWRHSVRYELRGQWFGDKITTLVECLMPHKTFFHHLRATGGTAEIFVQFLGDGYFGDNVPLETLARMVELQLDFGIESFDVPQC
jgi:hypothetical protein